MKIAVFDHQLNNGGGKRFLLNLLCSIADNNDIKLALFCNTENIKDAYDFDEFEKRGIVVKSLKSLQRRKKHNSSLLRRAVNYSVKQIYPSLSESYDDVLAAEISAISRDFDLAYFPWPYLLKLPSTNCPKVATFHDFNFKYFFGTHIYNLEQLSFLNKSFEEWVRDAVPVVSTNFMKEELKYFYPKSKKINVIHLASLNPYKHSDLISDNDFEFKFLLSKPYIVFPVHLTSHKNIGNVIAALAMINKDSVKIRLVLTGGFTQTVKGKSGYYGLESNNSEDEDVIGLGYISDRQMHYLQQKSFAVLNASLYEAGNGVGLDAWSMGVPVLQSRIPAFEEHINLQGFKAFTFDPRNAHSIAQAIEECLLNIDTRNKNIEQSLIAARRVTWGVTADKYMKLFKRLY